MIKAVLRSVFKSLSKLQQWAEDGSANEGNKYMTTKQVASKFTEMSERKNNNSVPRFQVVNVWDYLNFKEGSQAHHIIKILDYEEWITMEEILRRVNELFGILYQNERSLYPYLKTLVDSGLLEASMNGGKMRWRKKNLMITVKEIIENEEIETRPVSNPLQ